MQSSPDSVMDGTEYIPALPSSFLLFPTGKFEPTQSWPLCVLSNHWKPPFLSQDPVSAEPGAAGGIGLGSFLKAGRRGRSLLLQSLSLDETHLGNTHLNPCFLPGGDLPPGCI